MNEYPALVEPAEQLTVDEVRRYSRHLIIPDVGMLGQKRLKNAKVLCVGAGGLGSPALMYLAAAGVGTLGIVEFDTVDESNLQRQIIHGQSDIGRSKAESARDSVKEINPLVNVIIHNTRIDVDNVMEIFSQYDLIVDGTDNFATRYLVNDAAAILGKPYIWGSIYRFDGQAAVFWSNSGPCYRCLHPTPPPAGSVPSCAEGGVLGVLCGAIGAIQSNEAIKLITGVGKSLLGSLLIYDALDSSYKKVEIKKSTNCPICNGSQSSLLPDYEEFCGIGETITAQDLRQKSNYLLIDVREPVEHAALSIPGALLIPMGKFEDGSAFAQIPADKEIILHCRSGVRSAKCLALLKAAGFNNSKHLKGGIIAWEESR